MPATRTCTHCGKPFVVPYPSDKRAICSRDCWRDYVATHKSPQNKQVPLSCTVCGKPFEVAPYRLATGQFCSPECKHIGLRRRRQSEIERKFGKPIFALLYDLYCIQGLGIKQIAKKIGVSNHKLWDWFNDLGIQRRKRSDAVALQWLGNEQRKANQRAAVQKAIANGTLDPQWIVRVAKSDWARKRNSESKQGAKNWMFKRGGPRNPHWKGGKIYYYGPSWNSQRNAARKRDNYTCQHCGVTEDILGKQLDVHHIHKFRLFGLDNHEQANHLDNLISLCHQCHVAAEIQSDLNESNSSVA